MKLIEAQVFVVGGLALILMSCTSLRGEKKEASEKPEQEAVESKEVGEVEKKKMMGEVPRLVGRVVIVEEEQSFVLFKRIGMQGIHSQALLSLVSEDGRTASLRMSGEKHGRYFAADISSGNPRVGDLIYARSLPGGYDEEVKKEDVKKVVETKPTGS